MGKLTIEISKEDGPPTKVIFIKRESPQINDKAKKTREKIDMKKKKIDELVDRFQAGEKTVATELFEDLKPLVKSYVRARYNANYCISADDIEQETFLAVHNQLPHYERQENKPFVAFVYRLAANKVSDAFRAMRREQSDASDQLPEDAQPLGVSAKVSVEEQVVGRYNAKQLIDTLNAREKEVVFLRLLGGFSAEETAEIMDMPSPGAVRVTQHRAMPKIRKILKEE